MSCQDKQFMMICYVIQKSQRLFSSRVSQWAYFLPDNLSLAMGEKSVAGS